MINILVVDDDKNIRNLLYTVLKKENYNVLVSKDGEEALDIIYENSIDLAIIDIMMPKLNGIELTSKIKELLDIPILILTAKGEISDKILAFNTGSDDYLVKPFDITELILRVNALLKRYIKISNKVITLKEMVLDYNKCSLFLNHSEIDIPLKEFQLLYKLASFPQKVFTRNELIESIWGFDYDGDDRTVDVHIKRLREKLTDSSIKIITIRGLGYKLKDDI
ncbi:response regulator transcription factor [Clostridium chrysemydis]|uniref:response regulator transcription factor n=1 Tax=Clostridium chrysemydis TaxID=2665504 RepID=UPI001883AE52|nr:response regulator transcription factor [Clostridium chrysemydis]